MKAFQAVLLSAALVCCASVCPGATVGSGKIVSETRAVHGVHALTLESIGEVTVVQGDKEGLIIEAEDNILPLIESKVKSGGSLVLKFKEHDVRPTKPVVFKLSVKGLDAITLDGSGTVHAGRLIGDTATLSVPGSGEIAIVRLTTKDLHVSVAGSGKIRLGGGAGQQTLRIDGSGSYEAGGFVTSMTEVSVSGSGTVTVCVDHFLSIDIAGSGTVSYYGNPRVEKSVTGAGTVRSLGAKGT